MADMRLLGLIGGMSWASTISYYRRLNQIVAERLGGQHSARLLLYSVEFDEIHELQHSGRWEEAGGLLADAARRLVAGGAEGIEPASRRAFQRVIDGLAGRGAQAVILGCTEIALMIGAANSRLPVFDTTELHVAASVDFALGTARQASGA